MEATPSRTRTTPSARLSSFVMSAPQAVHIADSTDRRQVIQSLPVFSAAFVSSTGGVPQEAVGAPETNSRTLSFNATRQPRGAHR
jgi:hypothetical protein